MQMIGTRVGTRANYNSTAKHTNVSDHLYQMLSLKLFALH